MTGAASSHETHGYLYMSKKTDGERKILLLRSVNANNNRECTCYFTCTNIDKIYAGVRAVCIVDQLLVRDGCSCATRQGAKYEQPDYIKHLTLQPARRVAVNRLRVHGIILIVNYFAQIKKWAESKISNLEI